MWRLKCANSLGSAGAIEPDRAVTTTSSLRQRRSVLVGLAGAGIQASRTPRLHEREGAEHGLTYIYKVIDLDALGLTVDALPEIMTAAERLGFRSEERRVGKE